MNIFFGDVTADKNIFEIAMGIFYIKDISKRRNIIAHRSIKEILKIILICFSEAYYKRKYEAYLLSRSSGSDMEDSETQVWLDLSWKYNCIISVNYSGLIGGSALVNRLLNQVIEYFEKFLREDDKF